MNTAEQHPDTVEQLLIPIEQALDVCAHDPSYSGVARQCLISATEDLESVADDSWLSSVKTLASLLEIVECFADGSDEQMTEISENIIDFVKSALPNVGASLADPLAVEAASLLTLAEEARHRWGEYLTLVGSDSSWETSALDQAIDSDDADGDQFTDLSTQQVDLILSTLGGGANTANDRDHEPESISGQSNAVPQAVKNATSIKVFAPEQIDLDDELLEAYQEDVEQCLASMERAVLEFENSSDSTAPLQQLGRDLHTLKGASASVGLVNLAAHLHSVEEWLQSAGSVTDSQQLEPVLTCVDAVRTQVNSLKKSPAADSANVRPVTDAPQVARQSLPVSFSHDRSDEPGDESVRVKSQQLDRLMDLLVELVTWRRRRDQRVLEVDRAADELSRCTLRLESFANQFGFSSSYSHRPGSDAESTDRQQARGYLKEITSDVREIASVLQSTRQSMADENRSVSQFIQQFRQQLVQLRRLPLSGLFQRLQRVARDAARVEQKQVRLEFIGEHAGLERSLQERLYEPLLHLVRNAVGHGIESPEIRRKAGKRAEGTITVEAFGSSHLLILEIRDDGGGLDFDAIRRRGHERGLLPADRSFSEQELTRLIFHPGFSTRSETNEVAGRGVGMDVVAAALDRCNCQIDVDSVAGKGTTFRLSIPLPSVIEHSLIVRCGGQLFGMPMQFVLSTSDTMPTSKNAVQSALTMADVLGVRRTDEAGSQRILSIKRLTNSRNRHENSNRMLPRGSHGGTLDQLELSVDAILGTEEVVVRPLPQLLRRHPLLSGVSLSGSGEVVLLLDGNRLEQAASSLASSDLNADRRVSDQRANHPQIADLRRILVADDSLSARRRLVQTLQPYGFEITEVSDGLEALEVLRTESFDAVFSDLEMPRLGGFDLLTELKRGDRDPAEPVVIVTTRSEAETQERARQLGANGFIAKPVSATAVEDVLRQLALIPSTTH
ncbi:MAG: response regulator [Planctomycetaceae bacterium]|nr:response regulator [Planctomycetaceae bacterium]